jgi:hypothetical protein
MSSYYRDGVTVGNAIFGLLGVLVLVAMASNGQPIAIVGIIILALQFIVALKAKG